MSTIFVSFHQEDKAVVESITSFLEQAGHSVYLSVGPADSDNWVQRNINAFRASSCVIVVWSQNSAADKGIVSEALNAQQLGKLIAIRLDAVPLQAPFNTMDTIDFRGWAQDRNDPSLIRLLSDIQTMQTDGRTQSPSQTAAGPATPDNYSSQSTYDDRPVSERDFGYFYFSVRGRISQADYWLRWILPWIGITFIFLILIGAAAENDNEDAAVGIFLFYIIVTFWPGIATSIKRLHDIDWPGWVIVFAFVPYVGVVASLVFLVVNLFVPGTTGPNKYGPDPRTQQ